MSEPEKENGDVVDNNVNPPPKPQRKPRLNRRGFHLTNHPIMKLLSDKPDEKKSSVNGLEQTDDEIKTNTSQKKIISLKCVKNKMSSSVKDDESPTTIKLKTSVNTGNENLLNTEKKIISLKSVKSKMSSSVKDSESPTTIKLKTSVSTGNENLLNTEKKIISLKCDKSKMSSSVKGSESSTIIKLKTSVNTGNKNLLNTEVSSSSDSPPKKKHKPITWP